MSLLSAMYAGSSALANYGDAMGVVSNNLSNTNTVAFRSSGVSFADFLSKSIGTSGAQGLMQVGNGVKLSSVFENENQGQLDATANPLDVALEGPGFFILKPLSSAATYYTRAGDFKINKDGFLVNSDNMQVQGKALTKTGSTGNPLTDYTATGEATGMALDNVANSVKATTQVNAVVNLMSDSTTPSDAYSPANVSSYNYSASVVVYDSQGSPHPVELQYRKTAPNTWERHLVDATSSTLTEIPNSMSTLVFSTSGLLTSETPATPVTINWGGGAAAQPVTFSSRNSTQYSANSSVRTLNQDGFPTGTLQGVTVDERGRIIGNFSNRQTRPLYQLQLAKFINPQGLDKQGSNLYSATSVSGIPKVDIPGSAGFGQTRGNSLEHSTVDLPEEFIRMIALQRAFQANSRVISTTDGMMEELVNLRR